MAYERLEPFGPLASDLRSGQVCATVANVQRGPKTEPYGASDFMPALRRAMDRDKPVVAQESLNADQHAALMDASLFGVAKT